MSVQRLWEEIPHVDVGVQVVAILYCRMRLLRRDPPLLDCGLVVASLSPMARLPLECVHR
jgi:hypothetical protein